MSFRSRTSVLAAMICVLAVAVFAGSPSCRGSPLRQTRHKSPCPSPKNAAPTPLDGRLLLLLSNDGSAEPRMQIALAPRTQMIFGVDVDNMQPGQSVTIDDSAFGYPVRYLHDVPAGEYFVQVLLNRYETFHRADGHTVKLHMDQGEGQHWNISPGNLYSKPQKITLGRRRAADCRSSWIRRFRRSSRPRTRNTSATSRFKANC